jgi:SulP family sulfate permease
VSVGVGVVLAALLFMRRMAEFTQTREVVSRTEGGAEHEPLPAGVAIYEIAGALFFGAARNAISSLGVVSSDVRVLVLDLGRVPVIDVTGLVALESIATDLARRHIKVLIAGPLPQPRKVWDGAHLEGARLMSSRAEALAEAARLAAEIDAERAARKSVAPARSA